MVKTQRVEKKKMKRAPSKNTIKCLRKRFLHFDPEIKSGRNDRMKTSRPYELVLKAHRERQVHIVLPRRLKYVV